MESWRSKPIGELGVVITGKTPSTKKKSYWDGSIPFITPPDLNSKQIINAQRSIGEEGLNVVKPLPKGTVLTSCIGNIGRVGMTHADISVTNQQINSLIVDSQIADNWYCLYAIMFIEEDLKKAARKTTLPILNKSNFCKVEIPYPPLPEQQKIAFILFTIQKAIEQQDQEIKLTTELKNAIMQKLFTEGIRGEKQKDTEIGSFPDSWDVVKFVDYAEFKNGINFTKEQKGNNGLLTVDVLNMYGTGCRVSLDSLYRVDKEISDNFLLLDGDLLFVRSSLKLEGVGWTCVFENRKEPVTFCGFIIRSRLNNNIDFNPLFLAYYFRTHEARKRLISGGAKVAITNINQGILKQMLIPKPPFEEQLEISEHLDKINEKISVSQRKKDLLKELFRTILHQLMTARIRVDDIDLSEFEELGLELTKQVPSEDASV